MKNKVIYSFSILTLIFAMICSLLLVGNGSIVALAESNVSDVVTIGEYEYRNLHNTTIEDDLTGATLDGKPFSFDDYPVNSKGNVKFLSLVEFGYMSSNSDFFDLFVYVYNPTGNPISTISGTSSQNKMSICVVRDEFGEAESYEKFVLSYVDHTDDNLFYKFSVVMEDDTLFNSLNPNSRRYDIAEIELHSLGNNAISSLVGYRYIFTGYQQGCDLSSKDGSTLQCAVTKDLEVLELEVFHTVYRTNSSDKGSYYKNQINSCYFAIPNEVYNQYENIDYIKAEWWEYYTKLMLATNNLDLYTAFKPFTKIQVDGGTTIDDKIVQLSYGVSSTTSGIGLGAFTSTNIDWAYNISNSSDSFQVTGVKDFCNMIPAVFMQNDSGEVSSDDVKSWINSYSNELGNGYIDVNGRQISKDLFDLNYIAEGFNQGYNLKEIKFGDTFDLISYDENRNWLDKVLDYGFSFPDSEDSSYNLDFIKIVDEVDKNTISTDYLIAEEDCDDFYEFYNRHKDFYKVVLLRFAVSNDYFSRNVNATVGEGVTATVSINEGTDGGAGPAYIAQERVYFDFSIIQINFMKDGKSIAIPVATDPQDNVGGLEGSEEQKTPGEHLSEDLAESLKEIKTWFDKFKQDIVNFFSEIWSVAKWVLIVVAGLLVICGVIALLSRLFPRRVRIKFKQPKQSKKNSKRKYVKPPKV